MRAITGRTFFTLGLALLSLTLFCSEAFSWGFATHTYIDGEIGKKMGQKNNNELYGGVAPDLFNYVFELPYQANLAASTHDDFMKLWHQTHTGIERALGFGFVSHNDVWGADYTAHHSGITFGQGEGYVIAKASMLAAAMECDLTYQQLQIPDEITLQVAHELIEQGIDIMLKKADPLIGQRMVNAALTRSKEFPDLLVDAYAADVAVYSGMTRHDAAAFIKTAERKHREKMILYGTALMQDEDTALQLLSEQTAEIAAGFLASYGIVLPSEVDLTSIVNIATKVGMDLCANDFLTEIEATADYVDRQMWKRGIRD
jgi:hypothetical protein